MMLTPRSAMKFVLIAMHARGQAALVLDTLIDSMSCLKIALPRSRNH